jgi:hypothetical protein
VAAAIVRVLMLPGQGQVHCISHSDLDTGIIGLRGVSRPSVAAAEKNYQFAQERRSLYFAAPALGA